jgi:hypothetical protein
MAVRHVKVVFSAEPTKTQAQRFFSLILQNVTDFSGYTADPMIGSYLTGGNTITVNAYGDNMPATIIADYNPGTANATTVLQIGNLYHTVMAATSGCLFACSVNPDSYILPSNRAVYQIAANSYSSALSMIYFSGSVEYSLRVSESYIAIARRITVASPASSATDSWKAWLYTLTDSVLQFVIRHDYWKQFSEFQTTGAQTLYPAAQVDPNRLNVCSILTNHGPLTDSFSDQNLASISATTAYGSGAGNNVAFLPGSLLDPQTSISRKPVFQFKISDANTGLVFDISGIHNVLMLNYGAAGDYSEIVSNGGVNYRAVGGFLFAS